MAFKSYKAGRYAKRAEDLDDEQKQSEDGDDDDQNSSWFMENI